MNASVSVAVSTDTETDKRASAASLVHQQPSLETVWHLLTLFSRYRVVIAVILGLMYLGFQRFQVLSPQTPAMAGWTLMI